MGFAGGRFSAGTRSVRLFQAFEVTLEQSLLFLRERQEFEAIMVSAPVADHGAYRPWQGRSRKQEAQPGDLTVIQFRCQKYADSSFGKIPAVSFKILILISQKIAHRHSEVGGVSRVPSPAPVHLGGHGFWRRGGHEQKWILPGINLAVYCGSNASWTSSVVSSGAASNFHLRTASMAD